MTDAPTTTASVREERKVVTVLFADLVGSTALGERLDAEEVKLVVGDAIGRIVDVVDEFGGYVKDLAGDGVLAFFGAPVAFEDDAERAVRAGLRITDEIGSYAAEVETAWGIAALGVRAGVSTGPVVVGLIGSGDRVEYAAFGDTVNTAARVQSAARPGTVLVDEETRRQVAPLFEWGDAVELELKGKGAPVTVSAVVSARSGAAKRRGIAGVQAPLVGRERELTVGVDAIAALVSGTGGIVFVTGDAGIGKSRLLVELRRRLTEAESARGLWLEGRCVSYGESLPYWPFRDLLREWLGAGRDDPELRVRIAVRRAADSLFGARASEIYPYLGALLGLSLEPDAGARLAQLSPEALQYRTFEVVEALVERLAEDRPVVIALEDLHWADPTSIQLAERLLATTERAAVLLVVSQRNERDHPSWALRELGAREFPHVMHDLSLEPLSGNAERELLHALTGEGTLPATLEDELLAHAEGNPFYLEELVRSLVDASALVHEAGGWRHDHDVLVEIPPTVEKVILSRIDRLDPHAHDVLTAASVLGRRFGLPLLEGVLGGNGRIEEALHVLQRVDLIRPGRRWPQPEYRFRHALIQEATYRTLLTDTRRDLHRRAAEWLERNHAEHDDEVVGLLAHHWLNAEDEAKAVTYLQRAADKARQEYALDEAIGHYQELLPLLEHRGESQEMAIALFKLALALHTSLRFAEANATYARAFELWTPPPAAERVTAMLRVATSVLPNDADPKSAIAWPDLQLCMQLFDRLVEAWPERSIVPSLAERWEIADDGLRYVFHLREGLVWSDGTPLTAHDVEYGIKRALDPQSPGSSVAIYFVLENGQDYYLGRNTDAERIGVRALDDRTVEFRLVAPAPYFMSVMNRPDAGPQPRHAIEAHGEAWTAPEHQVVSGPFRQAECQEGSLVLDRRSDYALARPGNVSRLEFVSIALRDALEPYRRDELDAIVVRYTPRLADVDAPVAEDATVGAAAWSFYVAFDHGDAAVASIDLRRALAHAVDRERLAGAVGNNVVVATGGLVPPALQGHTPDIALRLDHDLAREHLVRSGFRGGLTIATLESWIPLTEHLAASWREVLGIEVEVLPWTADAVQRGQVRPANLAPIYLTGWLPGYADPEYYLRLLLHSDSKTNEGDFSYPPFDQLIERARQERSDRARLELFHQADRMAVADRVALVPIAYGRSMAFVKPWVKGWWEFGKSSSSFADLIVDERGRR